MPLPRRAPDARLNPELERIDYQMKVIRQEAEGLVATLTEEQLHWRPSADRWSVAQCFQHLNQTNRKLAESIEVSVKQGRQANKLSEGPYTYGFLSRYFLRSLEPPAKRRFKAPGAFVPQIAQPWSQVMAEWNSTHDRLRELLHQSNGLDLAAIKSTSPASRWIRYPLGIAFWVHAAHDRRHLWQVRELINGPGFPKSASAAQSQPTQQQPA